MGGGRGDGLAARRGGSTPCRAPVLGEPCFVPGCASSARPPRPGQRGNPQAAHSPKPFDGRVLLPGSHVLSSVRSLWLPASPRSDEPRHSRGSSPDWDGDIPAPRSLLPFPAELGWGLRVLCTLWGCTGLGAVCTGEHLLGLGGCVCCRGVCAGWELGAVSTGGGDVLSGGCSLGCGEQGRAAPLCLQGAGSPLCLCVGPWMEPESPSSACQTAPLPGSSTAGADICALSPACLQLAPWHSHSGSWVPPYLSVVSPTILLLRDTNLYLWCVFLEGKLRQEGGKQQSPLLIPVIPSLDPTPHPGLFFPAK